MKRVLVVDDSSVARRMARAGLERRGVIVVEAASRADALRALDDRVDGALLDLELGDGSGTDVARAIVGRNARLPFVFVSASTDEPTLARARDLGPVFRKPGDLEDAIDALLRGR